MKSSFVLLLSALLASSAALPVTRSVGPTPELYVISEDENLGIIYKTQPDPTPARVRAQPIQRTVEEAADPDDWNIGSSYKSQVCVSSAHTFADVP